MGSLGKKSQCRTGAFAPEASLVACVSCARHLRVSEERCPFCGSSVAASAVAEPRLPPASRLGRAALYAFGVGALSVAAAVAGCNHEGDGPVAPVYGAPPEFQDTDAGHDAALPAAKPAPPKPH
jgi:hypothetical protein